MARIHKVVSRSFVTSAMQIKQVTVIGGGLMGSGIAQVAAQSGHSVTLVDLNENILKSSADMIEKNLNKMAKQIDKDDKAKTEFTKTTLANIKFSPDLQESVKETDLVIESIVEKLEAKSDLFSSIDNIAPKHALFATNTSSLSVTEIGAKLKRKDKFGGLHFFNPVTIMRLLEVIRTEDTSDATHQAMLTWGKQIGKVCISCKDTPGFVVNKLLVPQVLEAMRLLERGEASVSDVDIAMKFGAGYPMGPFEMIDFAGLDTAKYIVDEFHKRYPDIKFFEPVEILNKLVSQGKLGVKSGEGFYNYKK